MGGRRNSSCLFPLNDFDIPMAQSHTSPALATYLNLPQTSFVPAPPLPPPHAPLPPHNFAGYDDNFNLRGPPFYIMPHPSYFYNSASRYGHNGAAPGYQLHRPNSMHDYQPLAPFQDGNGAVHMQAMGTMGAPMAMGGSSGGPKGGMYEGQEEGLQGEGWCVNWKCIITLMCIFTLLLLSLLSLIGQSKLFYSNSTNTISQCNFN